MTPRAIALLSSLISSLSVFAVLLLLSRFNLFHLNLRSALLVLVLVFISAFAATSILINNSIVKRLTDLLNTIRDLRGSRPVDPIDETGRDVICDMTTEVLGWAQDRKNELEQLKKLENYRKEFLGNVSHELKTPIFNIQGYVLTLLEGGLEDETINRDYLVRAERSIDRMISIIDDLEAISQLETGELEIEPERFDIVTMIKDVFDAQEFRATGKGIILTYNDPEYRSQFVSADRFRIRQVLTNLVVNSIKYGKEYGETRIKVYDAGETLVVEVKDNGIGISPEHLPRLFERFYRVDKSRSREMGGTGLGLAIVKHIIEAHDQGIEVMSTPGVGSVFSFTLKKG